MFVSHKNRLKFHNSHGLASEFEKKQLEDLQYYLEFTSQHKSQCVLQVTLSLL